MQAEAGQRDGQLGPDAADQEKADQGAGDLADDGGHRRAGHPHVKNKDQDGVQNDVDDSAGALDNHKSGRVPGGLEDPLTGKLHTYADGKAAADAQVVDPLPDDLRRAGAGAQVGLTGEQPKQEKEHPAGQIEQIAVQNGAVGLAGAALAQPAGQHGAEAHPGAGAEGDHQRLDGVGVGQGQKGRVADAGDVDAVHQVVHRLHQHGEHNGPGHVDHQPSHGHRA